MNNIYNRNYSSLYRGVVEDNNDPKNLGRCRVRVPSIHGELSYPKDLLPWARPLVLSSVSMRESNEEGFAARGSVNIPDIGSVVWVLFEGSDREFPVYLGGTYATGEINIDRDIVDFYIEGNNKLSYNRKDRTYTVQIGENKLIISRDMIHLIGDTHIDKDLHISGNLSVGGNLSVKGNTVLEDLYVNGSFNLREG